MIVNCTQNSFWLYNLIWSVLLPLFVAYVASAAYAFQRRKSDIEAVHKAMREMRAITMLALDRLAGLNVDLPAVRENALELISRVRLELLHRPSNVQRIIHGVLEEFLKNAEIADGRTTGTPKDVLARQANAETQLIELVRQLTIVEALRQAWSNPGIRVSFDALIEKVSKFNDSK